MSQHSNYTTLLCILLLCSNVVIAQQSKQWSFSGTVGSSTQLSLSYNLNNRWQLSFVFGPYGNITTSGTDRIGLSAIYFLDASDTPLFIGYLHGKTSRIPHKIINVIPIGIQHKISDEFGVRIAAELTSTKNEFNRTIGGVGVSIGGSIYL